MPAGGRFRWARAREPRTASAEVIEVGRALGRLPAELVVVGVEARQFRLGGPMSPQVAASVELAAKTVVEVVRIG
jgi:hydrogenase maturation protease